MTQIRKLTLLAFSVLFLSLFAAGNLYGSTSQLTQGDYENPQWAPPFYEGVRYYYLPDIETYYDIESQEFVYLYDGQWCFSRECPSVNTGFDLRNCFTIALDMNVYQPWMHHHYYVSHYPRYYYQDYYDHSNIPFVRGFNENSRSAIFWKENERNRARHFDNEGMRNDRRFRYSNFDRQQQQNWNRNGNGNENRQPYTENTNRQQSYGNQNVAPSRNSGNNVVNPQRVYTPPTKVRTTQGTNYYGGTIGQPVKVEKQMRRQPDQQQNGRQDQHQDHQDHQDHHDDHQNKDNRR